MIEVLRCWYRPLKVTVRYYVLGIYLNFPAVCHEHYMAGRATETCPLKYHTSICFVNRHQRSMICQEELKNQEDAKSLENGERINLSVFVSFFRELVRSIIKCKLIF